MKMADNLFNFYYYYRNYSNNNNINNDDNSSSSNSTSIVIECVVLSVFNLRFTNPRACI